MLDQLSAAGAGFDQLSRNPRLIRLGDCVFLAGIRPISERAVYIAQKAGGAFAVHADHDAVRKQKICDRGALAQELRIGSNLEGVFRRAIQNHDAPHPLTGTHGNGTLLHYQLVSVHRSR